MDDLHKPLISGQAKTVLNLDLRRICKIANLDSSIWIGGQQLPLPRPITILAGSGINPATVGSLLQEILPSGLEEIHLSGGRWVEGDMWHRPEDLGMGVIGHEWSIWRTSEAAIRDVRMQADSFWVK